MKRPVPAASPDRGDQTIRVPGYSYLPRFITTEEADQLGTFFAGLRPLWEERYAPDDPKKRGAAGRLTRPVYWLGAWQFASLGYYAEPDHLVDRCLRAEPLPPVMNAVLQRLRTELALHDEQERLPNTCLINYYGRERPVEGGPPLDYARLRMHRDAEPGPVVMFSVGQPAQFEFVEPSAETPQHSQWVRHRSIVILSGPEYKDRLYHRVTRVRYGQQPVLGSQLDGFEVRRVSVSFRYVPERYIQDLCDLGDRARSIALPYVQQLAEGSQHYRAQLVALDR
ncbi:MAG: alkylated DNA repair protein (DNA oxidative demethylase) [Kiritimatiellia bacterium]|jgi:alkylated DNA repair protein (DNA oxidative demethylase)